MRAMSFEPTRTAALERLAHFVPKAGSDYARMRNHDLPGHPHVSVLSPYVRHRVVSEAEIAQAVLGRFSPSTAEKYLQEVCWRSYWKAWLDRRPSVWTAYEAEVKAAQNQLATQSGLRQAWHDACAGETGIACFDHWANELVETGYLHNHARMWFASIWMFTLHLPWALGADFFMRHLLDGDPASNTLSWRWVGGLQTVGKTYAARPDNIAKYTDGRFNPAGQLAPAHEVQPLGHPEHPKPLPVPGSDSVDTGLPTGLILTEDDLSPGFLLEGGLRPVAGLILLNTTRRSPFNVAPQVIDFTSSLAQDCATRWGDRVGSFTIVHTPEDAADWAKAHAVEQLVAPYIPTGPGRTGLDAVAGTTRLPLRRVMRPWDAAALPHATAGFFKFKARIPDLLATLQTPARHSA